MIFAGPIKTLGDMAQGIGLRMSAKTTQEILRLIEKGKESWGGQFEELVEELQKRVRQELEDKIVFVLPEGKHECYESMAPLFGQTVHDAFPSARDDIAEAGKCYALDRGTATAMHLMRSLEGPF